MPASAVSAEGGTEPTPDSGESLEVDVSVLEHLADEGPEVEAAQDGRRQRLRISAGERMEVEPDALDPSADQPEERSTCHGPVVASGNALLRRTSPERCTSPPDRT